IGAALIQEGHRIAQTLDYEAAFLVGHPTYYPKFGYQTHVYGGSSLAVKTEDLPSNTLESRVPTVDDLPALMAVWELEEQEIDFALRPDMALVDWLSPNPSMKALVYLRAGEIVAYR